MKGNQEVELSELKENYLVLVNKIVNPTASINKIIKKAFANIFLW